MQESPCLEIEQLLFGVLALLVLVKNMDSDWPFDHAPYVWKAKAVFPLVLVRECLPEHLGVDVSLVLFRL